MATRRQFTPEFKAKVALELVSGSMNLALISAAFAAYDPRSPLASDAAAEHVNYSPETEAGWLCVDADAQYSRPLRVNAAITPALVARVIDGDTVELQDGRRLRYIGVDTPETVAPGQPVQCYGPEASSRNKALVEGKVVGLEKDMSETDSFGRLLRYVYSDGWMVNAILVEEGYARARAFPPDTRYSSAFSALEAQAMAAGRGMWSACP